MGEFLTFVFGNDGGFSSSLFSLQCNKSAAGDANNRLLFKNNRAQAYNNNSQPRLIAFGSQEEIGRNYKFALQSNNESEFANAGQTSWGGKIQKVKQVDGASREEKNAKQDAIVKDERFRVYNAESLITTNEAGLETAGEDVQMEYLTHRARDLFVESGRRYLENCDSVAGYVNVFEGDSLFYNRASRYLISEVKDEMFVKSVASLSLPIHRGYRRHNQQEKNGNHEKKQINKDRSGSALRVLKEEEEEEAAYGARLLGMLIANESSCTWPMFFEGEESLRSESNAINPAVESAINAFSVLTSPCFDTSGNNQLSFNAAFGNVITQPGGPIFGSIQGIRENFKWKSEMQSSKVWGRVVVRNANANTTWKEKLSSPQRFCVFGEEEIIIKHQEQQQREMSLIEGDAFAMVEAGNEWKAYLETLVPHVNKSRNVVGEVYADIHDILCGHLDSFYL